MCTWYNREASAIGPRERHVQMFRKRIMCNWCDREACAIGATERQVQLVRERDMSKWFERGMCNCCKRERERERERRVQFVRGKVCNLKEHCPGVIGSVVILTHMLESNWSGSLYDVLRPRQVAQVAQTAHVGQSSGRRRGNRRRRRKPIMDIIYLPSIRSQLRAVIGSAITLTFGCSPEGCVRA